MANTNLVTRGLVLVAGIFAFAGGAYVTYKYLLGTPIEKLLEADDYTALTKASEDKPQWGKRWKEYVAKGNKWSLASFEANQSKIDDAPTDFKDTCIAKSLSKVKDNKDPNYIEFVDLCTKDFPIFELINKDKSIVLIDSKTDIANAKWKRYLEEVKTSNPLGLVLTNLDENTAPQDYLTKCAAKSKEEVKNNKDKKYQIVKEWCT